MTSYIFLNVTKGKSKAFVYFDFENCARVYRDYPSYCNTLNEARKAVRELIKSA